MNGRSRSPPSKRIKVESLSPVPVAGSSSHGIAGDSSETLPTKMEDEEENHCSICLQDIVDRTVIPICSHEFCFECLLIWTEQSRRCPLCSQSIGEYLIHSIRSRYDFRKHYLTPLRTSPVPVQPLTTAPQVRNARRRRTAREREWGRREREEQEESDKLDRSIARRRWLYTHDLYAKHVASNSHTRFRPYPTPAQFAASTDLISRTTAFLRRELRVWENLDVEFLTTFIISIMKAIDIRSESAVKLLAEFLDMDAPYVEGGRHVNAEHFAHEIYTYVRSPYKDLFVYDTIVQYDTPPDVAPAPEQQRSRRWRELSESRSRSPPRSHSPRGVDRRKRTRSLSWSPSGRRYSSAKETDRYLFTDDRRHHTIAGTSRESDVARQFKLDSNREKTPVTKNNHELESKDDNQTTRHTDAHHIRPMSHAPSDQGDQHGRDVKGKRRADGEGIPRTITSNADLAKPQIVGTTRNEPTADLAHDEVVTSLMTTKSTKPSQRPPRNRSLLQSVQAHLLNPKDRRDGSRTTSTRPTLSDSSSQVLEYPGTPSLLGRLSDMDARSSSSPVSLGLPPPEASNNHHDDSGVKPHTSMSAPKIMARTRARMAKSGDAPFPSSSRTQLAPSQDSLMDTSKNAQTSLQPSVSVNDQSSVSEHASFTIRNASSDDGGAFSPVSSSFPQPSTSRNAQSITRASPRTKVDPDDQILHPLSRLDITPSNSQSPMNSTHVEQTLINSVTEHISMQKDSPIKSASSTIQSHLPTLDLRARLLIKLEEGKSLARGADPEAPAPISTLTTPVTADVDMTDRISLNPDSSPTQTSISETHSPCSDIALDSQEAKLRSRALLRVRLAAEKRRSGDVPGSITNVEP